MRNQLLQGYIIHYRKYREKSYIIYVFSQENGRVDGILRQTPPPQYQPIRLLATGKNELKNFSHLEMLYQPVFFVGDAYFLGFYLNEILLRLAPNEQDMPYTFLKYQQAIEKLQYLSSQSHKSTYILSLLRQFEHGLLQDLGYLPDLSCDAQQQQIQANQRYDYSLNDGFILAPDGQFAGDDILTILHTSIETANQQQLQFLTTLYRHIIQQLLGNKPLKSRQLWIKHKN